MKQNSILIVAVILAMVTAVWWAKRIQPNRSSDSPTSKAVQRSRERQPDSEAPKEIPRPFNATPEQRRAIDEENERRHAEFMNIPIIFYGRVVDQDSKPLAGVQIMPQVKRSTNLVEHYAEVDPVTKCQPVFTDASGHFVIQGYRGYLLDFSLTRDGYRGWGGGASYDRRLPDCHKPNANKPVEFMLISDDLPMAERVYSKILSFVWNTGPVTVDCGPTVGSMVLTPTRNGMNPASKRQAFDWSVDVLATGFGMVLLTEKTPKVVPTDGYDPSHRYNNRREVKEWPSRVRDQYAIRTADGKYGLMELQLFGDGEDNGVSGNVTIYLNKSGARNIDHK